MGKKDKQYYEKVADWTGWVMEFQTESDRAAAVLGGAQLEHMLELLLRSHFASQDEASNLLAPTSPLGAYLSKARLCFCLGLISLNQFHDLKVVAKIRNKFAHGLHDLKFETESIKGLCNNLITPQVIPGDKPVLPPRDLYVITVSILSQWLVTYALDARGSRCTEKAEPPAGFPYIPKGDLNPYDT